MTMRFHHRGLTVPDLDEAIAFFQKALGFEIVLRTAPGGPAATDYAVAVGIPPGTPANGLAVLRGCGTTVELFDYGQPPDAAFPPNHQVGGQHLAFEVDDLDAALALLVAAGCTPRAAPRTAAAPAFRGMRWVYVIAPFGLQLELVQFPDGSF